MNVFSDDILFKVMTNSDFRLTSGNCHGLRSNGLYIQRISRNFPEDMTQDLRRERLDIRRPHISVS